MKKAVYCEVFRFESPLPLPPCSAYFLYEYSSTQRTGGIFGVGLSRVGAAFSQLSALLRLRLPRLALHLERVGVSPDTYATG